MAANEVPANNAMAKPTTDLGELIGEVVVMDLSSPFVFVGRLIAVQVDYLVLEEADAHDLRDTATTREKYIRESRLHGVTPNRRKVWVSRRELIGISRLQDVLVD